MHVEIDIKSMQTNFDGYGLSALGDIATLQKWPNICMGYVHGHQKFKQLEYAQKIYASRV